MMKEEGGKVDSNKAKAMRMAAKRTAKALEGNNFTAAVVETGEDVLKLVRQIVPAGASTASGGSVTLLECGIEGFLRKETDYLDRWDKSLTDEERRKADGRIHMCDFYFASANAITEHGEIYQVDGRSNRIANLVFGPEKVVIVAGMNKVVPDLAAAVERVKRTAAPANAIRLDRDSHCAKTGVCVSPGCDPRHLMHRADCGEATICRNTLIMGRQQVKGRVTVILVMEDLGY